MSYFSQPSPCLVPEAVQSLLQSLLLLVSHFHQSLQLSNALVSYLHGRAPQPRDEERSGGRDGEAEEKAVHVCPTLTCSRSAT